MSRIYNLSRISHFRCYTIDDICNLYETKKLHEQTVRKWIKKGLETIDNGKPALIYGTKLKEFLAKLNEENHHNLDFGEFYCFACKEAHIPLHKEISLEQNSQFIRAKGLCPKTRKIMNKSYKLADYPNLKKFFNLVELSRLYDSLNGTFETQIQDNVKNSKTESAIKQEEFDYE